MISSNSHILHAEGSQALQDQIEAFAFHWIKGWRSHASVPSELAAVHTLTTAALVRAAEKWNYQRNSLRVMPAEVLEHCWSFLDTPDLVRAARVCKAWKNTMYNTPALWTDITFYAGSSLSYEQLGVLLGLSKERLIRVSISTGVVESHERDTMPDILGPHAHRLYQLELHDRPSNDTVDYWRVATLVFDFEAPKLRSFTCSKSAVSLAFRNFQVLCPELKFVSLTRLNIWQFTPLPNVTSLEFKRDLDNSQRLYHAFPGLVLLKVSCAESLFRLDLPKGSPPDTLQHVTLDGFDVSFDDLADFGLTNVRELEYHGRTFGKTLGLFARLGGTPRSAEVLKTRLVVRTDTAVESGQLQSQPVRTIRISFPIDAPGQYNQLLELESVREHIQGLSIFPGGLWHFKEQCFILPASEFPALQTLELVLSAATDWPPIHALLNLDVMRRLGQLRVPSLHRLAISRLTGERAVDCRHRIEPIPPLVILVFIARHLELAPGRRVEELSLDGENGIQLCEMDEYNDSLQILQSHVGTISYRYEGSGSTMAY